MPFKEGLLFYSGCLRDVAEATSVKAAYGYIVTPVAEGLELEVIPLDQSLRV
jgi:hypothetical protein